MGKGRGRDVLAVSIPSTSLSLTARSTVLSVSLAESTTVLWSGEAVEKAARWAMVVVWVVVVVKRARGRARRAAESSGRKDILGGLWCCLGVVSGDVLVWCGGVVSVKFCMGDEWSTGWESWRGKEFKGT